MMSLMVEQMRACHVRCLYVVSTLIIRVRERSGPKDGIKMPEKPQSVRLPAFLRSKGRKNRRKGFD